MDARVEEVLRQAGKLFADRAPLMNLWQEIADNFYPQRADFTASRTVGTEYAAHLMSSHPVMCHRDLANFISSARPADREWFKIGAKDDGFKEHGPAQSWFGYAGRVMLRAMYDRQARFTRATKEADRDFAAFGQAPLTVELNYRTNALLYRTWHLRDVCWTENPEGEIDCVYRKWSPTLRNLVKEFGRRKMAPELLARLAEAPHETVDCYHVVMPAEDWDWGGRKPRNAKLFPVVCLYIDARHQHVIDEVPMRVSPWVIPRWETIGGSQYAFSPAAVISLPDARLLQQQMLAILESGQRAADPPIIYKQDLFREDMNIWPGGFSGVDIEGDQRLQDLLMQLPTDAQGLGAAVELVKKTEDMLAQAWFLNRIFMPAFDPGEKMTAFEVSKRSEEAYRAAVTLFEPIEAEYNARLCETTFTLLLHGGAFDLSRMPDELSDQDVEFTFESPLRQARGRADIARFGEATQLTGLAATVDPTLPDNFNAETAYRDAMRGVGADPNWLRDPHEVDELRDDRARQKALMQAAATVNAGAEVAGNVGDAALKLREGLGVAA